MTHDDMIHDDMTLNSNQHNVANPSPSRTLRRLSFIATLATTCLVMFSLSSCVKPATRHLASSAKKNTVSAEGYPQIAPPVLGKVNDLPPPKELHKSTLSNGLRVRTNKDERLPLTGIGIIFDTGSSSDPLDKVGLTSLTFDLLRQGTKENSAEHISEIVDTAGVSLSGHAGYETSALSCAGKRDAIGTCVSLMKDILTVASFPSTEIDLAKKRYVGTISQRKDAPATIAKLHLINMIYGDDHVAGVALNERGIKSISRDDIVHQYQRITTPQNAVLVITGSFDDEILKQITEAFGGDWRKQDPAKQPIANKGSSQLNQVQEKKEPQPIQSGNEPVAKWRLIDSPKLSQCFFSMGHKGVSKHYAKRDALKIANYTLGGGGFSSRLMKRIRADQGKTYGIGSGFSMNRQDGHFLISSFTQNKHIANVLKLVIDEVKHYLAAPTTQSERDEAIGRMAGGYILHFETPDAIAYASVRAELDGFDDAHVLEYPTRLASQRLSDILGAAKDSIRPDQLMGAIVCPASEVAPLLKAANIAFETYSINDPIKAD